MKRYLTDEELKKIEFKNAARCIEDEATIKELIQWIDARVRTSKVYLAKQPVLHDMREVGYVDGLSECKAKLLDVFANQTQQGSEQK